MAPAIQPQKAPAPSAIPKPATLVSPGGIVATGGAVTPASQALTVSEWKAQKAAAPKPKTAKQKLADLKKQNAKAKADLEAQQKANAQARADLEAKQAELREIEERRRQEALEAQAQKQAALEAEAKAKSAAINTRRKLPPPRENRRLSENEAHDLAARITARKATESFHANGLADNLDRYRSGKYSLDEVRGSLQADDITTPEAAAITHYTGGGYDVNRLYFDPELLDPKNEWRIQEKEQLTDYADLLASGLAKGEKFKSKTHGHLFRGEDYSGNPAQLEKRLGQFSEAFQTGKPVQIDSFLSTSRNQEIASQNFKGQIQMVVNAKGKNGVELIKAALPGNRYEEEVLFNRGARFKVARMKKDQATGITTIWLDEV